jgi:hypothetical protein
MLRRVDLMWTDVSDERIASIFRVEKSTSHLLTLVPRLWIFLPWRWRRYVPPKRQFKQDLQDATFQMIAFFTWSIAFILNTSSWLGTGTQGEYLVAEYLSEIFHAANNGASEPKILTLFLSSRTERFALLAKPLNLHSTRTTVSILACVLLVCLAYLRPWIWRQYVDLISDYTASHPIG